jgi:hypothetical protein
LSREQMIGIAPKIPKPLTFSIDPEGLTPAALDSSGSDAADSRCHWNSRLVATSRLT